MFPMDAVQLLVHMKHFVKSTEKPSTSSVESDELKQPPRTAFVSGSHVKQFYERTVGKEALETTQKVKLKKDNVTNKSKSSARTVNSPFSINLLMKLVELGNTTEVENILEKNKDGVNCCDQFGWTPLMSACCAGNRSMVQLLLRWNPDLSVCDRRGQSCRDLAIARGHRFIIDILDQYVKDTHKTSTSKPNQLILPPRSLDVSTFYCKVCKQNVENTTVKKHLSSTVHNFHSASKRKMPTMYGIPESNKGFQILLKSGWNKEDGLGPSGVGQKFPPKTILKQDRTGLGAKRYKARVTHSVEHGQKKEEKPKNLFKQDLKKEKRKEQRLERNLRRMLS